MIRKWVVIFGGGKLKKFTTYDEAFEFYFNRDDIELLYIEREK